MFAKRRTGIQEQIEAITKGAEQALFDCANFSEKDISDLAEAICQASNLRILNLHHASLRPQDIETLAPAILANTTLTVLSLSVYDNDPPETKALIQQLRDHVAQRGGFQPLRLAML